MAIKIGKSVQVIAFVGKIQSGKTTAAQHLVQKYNYYRLRFADPLKRMLAEGLGIGYEYIDGKKKNESCEELCGTTVRHAMITLGTEWGRDMIHPNIWVNLIRIELMKRIQLGYYKFVIDDVRFVNEAEFVQKDLLKVGIKSMLVRLVRKDLVESIDHRSETEQDIIKPDYTILNQTTLEMLYSNIDSVLQLGFKEKENVS